MSKPMTVTELKKREKEYFKKAAKFWEEGVITPTLKPIIDRMLELITKGKKNGNQENE